MAREMTLDVGNDNNGVSSAGAYVAAPERAAGPAVLVLHAWWGLNGFIRQFCDRLAAEGFVALAPDAFRLGAKGFVLKQSSGEELVKAIDSVLEGHKYMSSALTDEVLDLMSAPSTQSGPVLTSRQTEVLRLIVNGQRMKEIAASLNLSPRTVETIKYEIMRELDVHSTAELVKYAIEHKLVAF